MTQAMRMICGNDWTNSGSILSLDRCCDGNCLEKANANEHLAHLCRLHRLAHSELHRKVDGITERWSGDRLLPMPAKKAEGEMPYVWSSSNVPLGGYEHSSAPTILN